MLIPSLSLQSISFHGKPNNKILSITNSASSGNRLNTQRKTISAFEARISLIFALASQSTSLSQRRKCYYYYKTLFSVAYFFHSFDLLFIMWCSCYRCGYWDCKILVSEKIWKSKSRRSFDDRCFLIFLLNYYSTNSHYYCYRIFKICLHITPVFFIRDASPFQIYRIINVSGL
jgi:hypothetical protein